MKLLELLERCGSSMHVNVCDIYGQKLAAYNEKDSIGNEYNDWEVDFITIVDAELYVIIKEER